MTRRLALSAAVLLLACGLAGAQSHRVEPGDNLYLIAKRYGVSIRDLVEHNKITNRRLIRPGMVLQIPPAAQRAAPSQPKVAAEARTGPPAKQGPTTAVVQAQPEPKPEPKPQPQPIARLTPAPDAAPSKPAPATLQTDPAATPLDIPPLPPLALGAGPKPAEEAEGKGMGVGMIADLVLKLVIVLVFVYASVWALKRFSQRRGRLLPAGGSLQVVETTSLAPNRGLHLVAVGKRVFLVGSTPENISLLGEVSDEAELGQRAEADRPSFGAQLHSVFKHKEPERGAGGMIAGLRDGTAFLKQAAERARALGRQGPALDRHV